ncbi:MAG TPA: AbrB/MazE/SpoVT family DNA-binding domain-containing protein [Longimicrobium sp.]|nr:AbrB/MazE/SpoVT family DNA-binding domain-containing protein [Longimicrobium sp.]
MQRATLGNASEVVVPPEIREVLGVGPGDEIVFDQKDDDIVVRKAEKTGLDLLRELAGPIWRGYAEELQRDRDEWDR